MSTADSRPVSEVPSYAKPSVTARLPSYSNQQAEAIRAAFVPNSFVTIGSLGRNIDGTELPGFKAGHASRTTFSDFVYTCSPYELTEQANSLSREEHEEKLNQIGKGQPFFAGYNNYKAKYETFQVEYMSEPYDLRAEHERQARWIAESKAIAGPFLPPGVEKSLEKPTRALLGDIMTALFRTIAEDWPEAQPTVLSTAEDLITIYFLAERVKSPQGLLAYMNNSLRRNEAVIEYELRKVPEGWHVTTKDNHMLYTLRPPWVKPRAFVPPQSAGERGSGTNSRASEHGAKPQSGTPQPQQ